MFMDKLNLTMLIKYFYCLELAIQFLLFSVFSFLAYFDYMLILKEAVSLISFFLILYCLVFYKLFIEYILYYFQIVTMY